MGLHSEHFLTPDPALWPVRKEEGALSRPFFPARPEQLVDDYVLRRRIATSPARAKKAASTICIHSESVGMFCVVGMVQAPGPLEEQPGGALGSAKSQTSPSLA